MNRSNFGKVCWALLAIGCSGKLNVGAQGSGGSANTGGLVDGPQGGNGHGGFSWDGGAPVVPGSLGERCIPGKVATEAVGSPAEADVKTQDRCNDGYTCSASGRCELIPRCDGIGSGDCLVFVAPGAGGAPAMGGSPGTGGYSTGGTNVDGPPLATEHSAITALAADQTRVYWTDYGSRDRLGNYNNDGALLSVSLESGAIETLATGLLGPIEVGLTNSYAYVMIDGGPLIGTEARPQLWRVPLSGGNPEPIAIANLGLTWSSFVAAGARAFLSVHEQIYQLSDQEHEASVFAPNAVENDVVWPLAASETHLYYDSVQYGGLRSVTIADGSREDLARPSHPIALHGEFMYGLELLQDPAGLMLTRAPIAGGNWVRRRALGSDGMYASDVQMVGDRYFFQTMPQAFTSAVRAAVVTALLDSEQTPVRILERSTQPSAPYASWWVGTANALFWTDGDRVYRRAIE